MTALRRQRASLPGQRAMSGQAWALLQVWPLAWLLVLQQVSQLELVQVLQLGLLPALVRAWLLEWLLVSGQV